MKKLFLLGTAIGEVMGVGLLLVRFFCTYTTSAGLSDVGGGGVN